MSEGVGVRPFTMLDQSEDAAAERESGVGGKLLVTSAIGPCLRCVCSICCQAGLRASSSQVQTELRTELKGWLHPRELFQTPQGVYMCSRCFRGTQSGPEQRLATNHALSTGRNLERDLTHI